MKLHYQKQYYYDKPSNDRIVLQFGQEYSSYTRIYTLHYNIDKGMNLFKCTYDDRRFCLPHCIAIEQDGITVLPRNPTILMQNDPHWYTSKTYLRS